MTLASIAVDEALLALKLVFLVLLYLFIWRIVRSASQDLRLPQESMIIGPGEAAALGLGGGSAPSTPSMRLVVVKSPALDAGSEIRIDSAPVSVGRDAQNDVRLDGDEYASARHARFEPRRDGLWVEDAGSSNGTFVNGARVTTPRRVAPGDVVRVGQTDLRVER